MFLYVDRNIIVSKEVPSELHGALEFVSRMIANDLFSDDMAKYIKFTPDSLKEVSDMTARMKELMNERAEGRAEGRTEGKAEGIINFGRKHHLNDTEIIDELMSEIPCNHSEAVDILASYNSSN